MRFRWLVPVAALLFATACDGSGGGVGPGPIDNPLNPGITSMDNACQALDADEVNEALKVDDVKLVADEPFKGIFDKEITPGRECGYLNKQVTDSNPLGAGSAEGLHGVGFSVSQFSQGEWKFDDPKELEGYWEKVAVGDLAYQTVPIKLPSQLPGQTTSTFMLHSIVVRHGDWVVVALGGKPEGMTDENFRLVLRDLTKRFVSKLPRS
jgi:hypothetical protein